MNKNPIYFLEVVLAFAIYFFALSLSINILGVNENAVEGHTYTKSLTISEIVATLSVLLFIWVFSKKGEELLTALKIKTSILWVKKIMLYSILYTGTAWIFAISCNIIFNNIYNKMPYFIFDIKFVSNISYDSFYYALISFAIIPPIVEEILFRGYLQRYIFQYSNNVVSVFITALFFALVHDFSVFFHAFFLGIGLSILVIQSDSLFPAMFMHMLNNISVLLMSEFL